MFLALFFALVVFLLTLGGDVGTGPVSQGRQGQSTQLGFMLFIIVLIIVALFF